MVEKIFKNTAVTLDEAENALLQFGEWWVFPKGVFVYVGKYWRAQGVIFPLKAEKVHALLYLQQLLDVSRENRKGREKILYTKKSTFP